MKLVFLGKLADLAGEGGRSISVDETLDWGTLCARLDSPLREVIESEEIRVAIDGELLPDKRTLLAPPDSEVAFLPPVSGG